MAKRLSVCCFSVPCSYCSLCVGHILMLISQLCYEELCFCACLAFLASLCYFVALGTLLDSYRTIFLDKPCRFSVYFCTCWTQESRDSYSLQIPPGDGAEYYALESPNISGHFIILHSDLSQGAQLRIRFRVPSQEPTDVFALLSNLPISLHQINPFKFWKQRKLCPNMSGFLLNLLL